MASFRDLRPAAKTFVAGIVLGGGLVLAQSIHALYVEPIDVQWFVFAGLTLLTGSFTVKVPGINASLSVSETFVFASVLLFGAPAGAITVLLECLIILFWMRPGRSFHKILFNTAAPAIAIWVSGSLFFVVSGIEPYSHQTAPIPIQILFLPLLAFTLLYFLLNSWLVATALGFETGHSPLSIWWNNFTWLAVNYFSGASVAALIVTYMRDDDISTLAVIVPLLVVSYLTFRTAMGRVEDSNRHLSELNRLYLSTIETLAMAIDAKDQITHGHIRRVQSYAVGLAKRIGVGDDRLIKAIEAAALLHDMGKLAVPEYILNKPGKLTPAEFEKMKLHASVGADILSAIEFPYPVVPIVRHHHENWDGTGYPAGLRGTDIPIGARILAVVDCFDALTSDRPYRPRLADEEALSILMQRRGIMYDPLVVDTFVQVHHQLAPESPTTVLPRHILNEITGATNAATPPQDSTRLSEIAASAEEMMSLYELAHTLAGQSNISQTGDVIVNHLRRMIPFSQSILFLYDVEADELEARHASGHVSAMAQGLRIPIGQRLSGWVAANRQTIVNSDPTLDLGGIARAVAPRLRSCLSACLTHRDQLVGVLTLYSDVPDGFTEDHRRVIEVVARQVAHTFHRIAEPDVDSSRDSVTGLPIAHDLERVLERTAIEADQVGSEITLLFVEVTTLKLINARHGADAADDVLRHVAACVRSRLRVGDILFRYGNDQLAALLKHTDSSIGLVVAERVRRAVAENDMRLDASGSFVSIDVKVTSVTARSLRELMSSRHRSSARSETHQVH
jgi:diguanylate cyclase (GGDEF)-like protein/putative nucleotidyltransferase with HDIG domain